MTREEALLQTIAELTARIGELTTKLADVTSERDAMKTELAHTRQLVEHMNRQLETLLKKLGLPTEPDPSPTDDKTGAAPARSPKPRRSRKKAKPHGRAPLPPELPRDDRVLRPLHCSACGGTELREVGEEVNEQLDIVPAQLRVRRTIRKTCACRVCNTLTTAATPAAPVERGRFTERFLGWLAWSKYGLHLPLERLLGELRRMGIELQVSTLCDQVEAISDLVEPIVRRLKAQLIAGHHVRTDGTGLLVLQRNGGKARLGQMAIYCSPTIAIYHYTPTKEGKHARDFLRGYAGHLVADASSTFDQLYADGRILEVGCWAHAKRKFDAATESEPRAANEALAFISELYDVEHRARERGIEGTLDHRALRMSDSVPILERFKRWLDDQVLSSLPKSPIGQAARYCVRHWDALKRFVDDAALPLDNNLSERLLRAVAVGRDNYVFAGSDAGAARAANLYSVIQTCKLVGVDPLAWLSDVLERIATWPISRLDELLPARWTNQAAQHAPAD